MVKRGMDPHRIDLMSPETNKSCLNEIKGICEEIKDRKFSSKVIRDFFQGILFQISNLKCLIYHVYRIQINLIAHHLNFSDSSQINQLSQLSKYSELSNVGQNHLLNRFLRDVLYFCADEFYQNPMCLNICCAPNEQMTKIEICTNLINKSIERACRSIIPMSKINQISQLNSTKKIDSCRQNHSNNTSANQLNSITSPDRTPSNEIIVEYRRKHQKLEESNFRFSDENETLKSKLQYLQEQLQGKQQKIKQSDQRASDENESTSPYEIVSSELSENKLDMTKTKIETVDDISNNINPKEAIKLDNIEFFDHDISNEVPAANEEIVTEDWFEIE